MKSLANELRMIVEKSNKNNRLQLTEQDDELEDDEEGDEEEDDSEEKDDEEDDEEMPKKKNKRKKVSGCKDEAKEDKKGTSEESLADLKKFLNEGKIEGYGDELDEEGCKKRKRKGKQDDEEEMDDEESDEEDDEESDDEEDMGDEEEESVKNSGKSITEDMMSMPSGVGFVSKIFKSGKKWHWSVYEASGGIVDQGSDAKFATAMAKMASVLSEEGAVLQDKLNGK